MMTPSDSSILCVVPGIGATVEGGEIGIGELKQPLFWLCKLRE